MEIKLREILISIIITLVLISIGLIIDNNLTYSSTKERELYNKSLKINNDKEVFKYSINTNVGNVLAYGQFSVENGIKIDELLNDYLAIKKITEKYKKHTSRVCNKCGKTICCHNKVYYSWDIVSFEINNVEEVKFLQLNFPYDTFNNYEFKRLELNKNTVSFKYIDKIRRGHIYNNSSFFPLLHDLRYSYYVVDKKFYGSILAKIKNNNLESLKSDKIRIHHSSINETIKNINFREIQIRIIFWLIYIFIIIILVIKYISHDNNYLY